MPGLHAQPHLSLIYSIHKDTQSKVQAPYLFSRNLQYIIYNVCPNFFSSLSRNEVFLDLLGLRPSCVKQTSSRKEVFQPHLPVRLPCYDLAPITSFALGRSLRSQLSGTPGFHGLTGGVYKARERIHRAMADARLLANPASRSRVADSDPN